MPTFLGIVGALALLLSLPASAPVRAIYARFLRNRFRSAVQRLTVISTDPSGEEQVTRMLLVWKDYRDAEDGPRDGVIAKTLVRIHEPYDLRRTTYLLIARRGQPHEQFVYMPSARRVRRIWLRGIGLLGTDYTLDDVLFQTIEDADYERLPDDEVAGIPVYVVEARIKALLDSQYERVTAYLDQENYVLLRALYRDDAGTLVRELRAEVESVDEFDGTWLATEVTMHNLRERTSSTLIVHDLLADVDLDERLFSMIRLEQRRD
jgi:hypothetical protein